MYNVFIEMPSGATSKPHDFQEKADAVELFEHFTQIMQPWKKFQAAVVLTESGKEIHRTEINNAA